MSKKQPRFLLFLRGELERIPPSILVL